VVNLAPSLLYRTKQGSNEETAVRTLAESEIYALRPVQLLLPSESHRSPVLAEPARSYEAGALFINENRSVTLGMLGSAGFVLLLIALVADTRLMATPQFASAARVNAVALLLSVAGGGGAIVSWLLGPQFRAMNRISVVIAFVSIAALLLAVDGGLRAVSDRWRRRLLPPAAILLLAIGLWDQIPLHVRPDAARIAAEFESDRTFVREIERRLKPQALVLQMPYIGFPEAVPLHKEPVYSHLRGFLQGENLRWSYGGMKGRSGDLWHRALAQLPLEEQVEVARQSGFSGIWVERRAIQDAGVELEAHLRTLGLSLVEESPDRSLAFFPLSASSQGLSAILGPPVLGKGFYGWEGSGADRWAWSSGNASFSLVGLTADVQRVKLSFTLHSLISRSVSVMVGERSVAELVLPPGVHERVNFEFDLLPGPTTVRLVTDVPGVAPGNGDNRRLAVAMGNIQLVAIQP
jgi:phosphoglycerol transferase